jgi:hypothetical protein
LSQGEFEHFDAILIGEIGIVEKGGNEGRVFELSLLVLGDEFEVCASDAFGEPGNGLVGGLFVKEDGLEKFFSGMQLFGCKVEHWGDELLVFEHVVQDGGRLLHKGVNGLLCDFVLRVVGKANEEEPKVLWWERDSPRGSHHFHGDGSLRANVVLGHFR